MNKNKNGYLHFSIIASVLIASIGALLLAFSILRSDSDPYSSYPDYAYEETVDHTATMVFSEDDGAQLYEGENASIAGEAKKEENRAASNYSCVSNLVADSSLSFSINSSFQGKALLKLNMVYLSEMNRDAPLKNIMRLTVNERDITLEGNASHSYNEYDFFDTKISVINLKDGVNHIDIISLGNGLSIDFLTLIPKKARTSGSPTIGQRVSSFHSKGNKQVFECERGDYFSGGVFLYDGQASSGAALLLGNGNDSFSMSIIADEGNTSMARLAYKNDLDAETTFSLSLFVNGAGKALLLKGSNGSYALSEAFELSLQKGQNKITIGECEHLTYFDYLLLNANDNHGVDDLYQRYEAEDGILTGNALIEENVDSASNSKVVAYFDEDSTLSIGIETEAADRCHFGICLSYWADEEILLSDLFSIYVNDVVYDSGETMSVKTDGYYDFVEIYLGTIALNGGSNVIMLENKLGSYNIDYLYLCKENVDFGKPLECEYMNLQGSSVERNDLASNGMNVGYNAPLTSINLTFFVDEGGMYELSFCLASHREIPVMAEEVFEVIINGVGVDLSSTFILPTVRWDTFLINQMPTVSLKEGINRLSIISIDGSYNADFISIAKLA